MGNNKHRDGIDMIGQKYGMLTVLSQSETKNKVRKWLCRCECGKEKIISGISLRMGITKSCGCYRRPPKHGGCVGIKKACEYSIWSTMKARCKNPKNSVYPRYGGRGIGYCSRWEKYINFIEDMGKRPSKRHSLERRDNEGNYEPDNCYWGTIKEQANNTRTNVYIEYKNITHTLMQWSEILNIKYKVLQYLTQTRKLSIEDIVNTDTNIKNTVFITHDNKTLNLSAWFNELSISKAAFYRKRNKGFTNEEIIEKFYKKIA